MVHPSRLLAILRNHSCRALNGLPFASPQPEVPRIPARLQDLSFLQPAVNRRQLLT
jgi:hypothetical protein